MPTWKSSGGLCPPDPRQDPVPKTPRAGCQHSRLSTYTPCLQLLLSSWLNLGLVMTAETGKRMVQNRERGTEAQGTF